MTDTAPIDSNKSPLVETSDMVADNAETIGASCAALPHDEAVKDGNAVLLESQQAVLESNSQLLKSNAEMMRANHTLLLAIAAKLGITS